jgi:hypothetical protein
VALAHQVAVHLYWALREASEEGSLVRMRGSPANSVVDVSASLP